jgi:phospholipid transport system substrate-binding protein
LTAWKSLIVSLSLGLGLSGQSLAASGPSPHQIIQATADELLAVIKSRRPELESSPRALYEVVDEVLRPNFDVDYAGRLVLGRYWPRATTEQRQRFIDALYGSLVRKYARGLLQYQEDTVRVLPHRGLIRIDEDFVTVKTEVKTNDGVLVPVDYRTRWTDDSWKVFDVVIEGLSYVTFYRDLIGDDVRQKGLDAVITDLESA